MANKYNQTVGFFFGQGNHARYVEAPEVQGHILASYPVCADTDTTVRFSCLLGIWRHASQPLQRLFTAPKIPLQRHGCHFNAYPPGTLIYLYIVAFNL